MLNLSFSDDCEFDIGRLIKENRKKSSTNEECKCGNKIFVEEYLFKIPELIVFTLKNLITMEKKFRKC